MNVLVVSIKLDARMDNVCDLAEQAADRNYVVCRVYAAGNRYSAY